MVECSDGLEAKRKACVNSAPLPRRLCYLVLALLALGVALRLRRYVFNPALSMDEAALAMDLRRQPLVVGNGSRGRMRLYPLGFLSLSKLSTAALGGSEYALRLVPFLSALIGLAVFYALARRCLNPGALAVAICLFAVSPKLVRYAVEAKPFSSDVAVVTVLAYLTVCALRGPLSGRLAVLLAAAGAVAVWMSFPATFCLAGFGAVLGLSALTRRQWGKVGRLSAVGLTWLASFGAYFLLALGEMSSSPALAEYWQSDFMPLPPDSLSDLEWLATNALEIFRDPGGLALSGLAALAFAVGFFSLARRRRDEALALIAPIGVTLLASGLRQYPFSGRLLLFCVPFLYVFIGEGAEQIRAALSAKGGAAGLLFMLLLVGHPSARALQSALVPWQGEDIRPVLAYVAANREVGDTLYVYYGAAVAVQYYAPRYGLQQMHSVTGVRSRDDWSQYAADIERLGGQGRTWAVFSHIRRGEKEAFLGHLDRMGARLLRIEAPGAAGYLYDLKPETEPALPGRRPEGP